MKSIAIYLLLTFMIISCGEGSNKSWKAKDQTEFMENCIEKARIGIGETLAKKNCGCMLDKIMKRYPDINDAENISRGETVELAKECQKMDSLQQK